MERTVRRHRTRPPRGWGAQGPSLGRSEGKTKKESNEKARISKTSGICS